MPICPAGQATNQDFQTSLNLPSQRQGVHKDVRFSE
jgi:hypothetical protein